MLGVSGNERRILVVDDDEGIRTSLSRVLRSSGHQVRVANDGFHAIEVSREFHPDLVLLDIRMPGMDGVETFEHLRSEAPGLAAIFMTAYATSERSIEAEERGAISVLPKPLDCQRLLKLIEATLSSSPILIADDDPALLKSIARAIEAHGIEVEAVTSLKQAIRALRKRPNRVVIADVFLEDGFGYELLKEMATRPTRPPFILITGRSDWLKSDAARGIDGDVVCLTKPIDIDELIQQVHRS